MYMCGDGLPLIENHPPLLCVCGDGLPLIENHPPLLCVCV